MQQEYEVVGRIADGNVVGESVAGVRVVGGSVVGTTAVGDGVMGAPDDSLGLDVEGDAVIGNIIVGCSVVGEGDVGARMVGTTVRNRLSLLASSWFWGAQTLQQLPSAGQTISPSNKRHCGWTPLQHSYISAGPTEGPAAVSIACSSSSDWKVSNAGGDAPPKFAPRSAGVLGLVNSSIGVPSGAIVDA